MMVTGYGEDSGYGGHGRTIVDGDGPGMAVVASG